MPPALLCLEYKQQLRHLLSVVLFGAKGCCNQLFRLAAWLGLGVSYAQLRHCCVVACSHAIRDHAVLVIKQRPRMLHYVFVVSALIPAPFYGLKRFPNQMQG